ncbi:MAG TPA: alpha/beta family hydrolase [Actinomycetota bacterium]|nr:alpha/beta family hydrolase [Actinomycetota bacterium]
MASKAIDVPGGKVSTLWDGPRNAATTVVLGHGAGADMTSDFMAIFADGLARADMGVLRFNFLYTDAGRRSPDKPALLESTLAAVAEEARPRGKGKLVLGGKSMGGRIASQVAAAGTPADGLLFLGYPLHPPGKPERIRDAHLYGLEIPMLFIEGTRDPFCPLPALDRVLKKLPAAQLAVIEDGDHSFKVRKSSGRSTPDAWAEAVDRAVEWIGCL